MSKLECRYRCAADNNVDISNVTNDQLTARTQVNIATPNANLRAWRIKNAAVLRAINLTVTPTVKGMLGNEDVALFNDYKRLGRV